MHIYAAATQQQQTQQQQTAADTTGAAAAATEGLSCFLCLEGFLFFLFLFAKSKERSQRKKDNKTPYGASLNNTFHPCMHATACKRYDACMQLHANDTHACNCMHATVLGRAAGFIIYY